MRRDEPTTAPARAPRIDYTSVFPAGVRAMVGLQRAVGAAGLEPRLLELLKLRASQINGYAHCLDVHSRDARALGRHIGAAGADLCNLINPERIVVGGSMAVAGDVLLHPLREAVELRAIPSAAEDVEIVLGELGAHAELLGAVALVLHEAGPVWSGPATTVRQSKTQAR